MGLGEPAPSLGTQVPHLRGCLAGTAYDLMLMGSVLCHVRLGAVGSSNDSEEAQGLRGRVVPGAEPLFSVLDFLKEPVRLYLSTAGLGGGPGGCFRQRAEFPLQTPFLLGWSSDCLTRSYLCAHLSPSFRTTCFGVPDLANKNRDAQLNLDFR